MIMLRRNKITSGQVEQSIARRLEKDALGALRDYAKNNTSIDETLAKIEKYEKLFRDKVPLKDYQLTTRITFLGAMRVRDMQRYRHRSSYI